MVERRKLGRGLSTLIPTERVAEPATEEKSTKSTEKPAAKATPREELPASALRDVPTTSIEPNPHQPRVHFDEESLSLSLIHI